ncbi:MAG: SIMPL domain-containing protein, partial [Gemmatimonadetes bacterium]|nr:SIMPL domain-containing protein [Gemmatimonadota bacterium]
LAPLAAPAPMAADTGVVRVTGSARVDVPADRARLAFAMETEARSAADAADANAERMQAVVEAVRGAVGDDGRIETSGYSLQPIYNRPEPGAPQAIVAYRVQNQVVVTLTDVDRVGPVLDTAVRAGANRVASMSFFAADTRAARLEAIAAATARAREEAEVLAAALGAELGSVLDVRVTGSPVAQGIMMRGAEMAMAADTPVEPGSQAVDVTVNLTFRLVER